MLRLWILAAGVLAMGAVRFAIRRHRANHPSVKVDSISSDWLAHERGRRENQENQP